MNFIGREQELKTLKEVYDHDGYDGIVVYGRRQIGKSSLLTKSIEDFKGKAIYYQCIDSNEKTNASAFCDLISMIFKFPKPSYDSFADCFRFCFEKSLNEKIILIVDEYPYLKNNNKSIDSELQKIIDTYRDKANLKLVLCGSFVGVMKSITDESSPLYRRLLLKMNLKQMDYYDSSLFYPTFSNEDKVRLYSVFGGVPSYNLNINPNLSFKENILNLIVSKSALFRDDPESSLKTEVKKISNGNDVFMAIAKGKKKFSDILSQSHVSSSPTLADTLNKLVEMDVIKKEFPINDEKSLRAIYSIKDRLSFFYYRYIYPRMSFLEMMPADTFYNEFIEKDFEGIFVPHAFEEVCKQYLIRRNMQKKLPSVLYKVGKYYYDDPKNHKNGEFDIVTLNKFGYDFYEAKFTEKPITLEVIEKERKQIEETPLKCNKLGFFSRSGYSFKNDDLILYTLDDIYRND